MSGRRETVDESLSPGNRMGLNPRRASTIHRSVRHPMTPGKTVIAAVGEHNTANSRLPN
jgi:hypothetical protein